MSLKRIEQLFTEGETLSSSTRRAIVANGDAAVPELLEIARDRDLLMEGSDGDGWAPIHAVKLLGELGAQEAVPDLLSLLEESDCNQIVYSGCIHALTSIGAASLEPTLAAVAANPDHEFVRAACDVLCRLGVRDDRVFELLVEGLETEPDLFGGYLADYGDPRGLEALLAAVERYEPDEDPGGFMANQTLVELEDAIRELGGQMTAVQQKRFDRLMAARRRGAQPINDALDKWAAAHANGQRPSPPDNPYMKRPERKIGRNKPCWCGSGKKYKKCHLGR